MSCSNKQSSWGQRLHISHLICNLYLYVYNYICIVIYSLHATSLFATWNCLLSVNTRRPSGTMTWTPSCQDLPRSNGVKFDILLAVNPAVMQLSLSYNLAQFLLGSCQCFLCFHRTVFTCVTIFLQCFTPAFRGFENCLDNRRHEESKHVRTNCVPRWPPYTLLRLQNLKVVYSNTQIAATLTSWYSSMPLSDPLCHMCPLPSGPVCIQIKEPVCLSFVADEQSI